MRSVKTWCVQARDGWHAAKGGRRPDETATNSATACGDYVTLPLAIAFRSPECPECISALAKARGEQ